QCLATDLIGDLTPQGIGDQRSATRLTHRNFITGHTYHRDISRCWQELRVEHALNRRREGVSPKAQVRQGNEWMGFPTTKCRLETMNGGHRVISSKAAKDLGQRPAIPGDPLQAST